jgi:2-keto-4-pentenoate hydratase/2-oxohepta-3-ene-1,7-dioic acid hydratase in catechol pathway
MRLLSYEKNDVVHVGILLHNRIVDVNAAYSIMFKGSIPSDMLSFLDEGEVALEKAKKVEQAIRTSKKDLQSISDLIINIQEAKVIAPIPRPRKNIICLGLNYSEHAEETQSALPEYPIFFTKPPTSVIGPNAPVLFPKHTYRVDYEAELAIVIGKQGKNIPESEVYDYIAGYTVFNDITARDFQRRHAQWFKGKGLDTFAPMGPCIVTKDEVPNPHNLGITLKVNDVLMQNSNTKHMIFKIPTLLSYLTMDMTVEPGDIIATGTPSGVGFSRKPPIYLKPGDVMEVTIEHVGVLQNKVISQIS